MNDIENRIFAQALTAATIVPSTPINRDTLLRDELGFTSLQAINLILDLEQEFNVIIPESELARTRTVGDVIDLVLSRMQSSGATV